MCVYTHSHGHTHMLYDTHTFTFTYTFTRPHAHAHALDMTTAGRAAVEYCLFYRALLQKRPTI